MALQVDIISDVVCPWCFIGKRNLEEALKHLRGEYPELTVAVRWHPFQLNPDTPEEGDPYLPFLERKFGGEEQVRRIWEQVRQAGAHAGIEFAFEEIAVRPNTLKAHRLIHRAQQQGNANTLIDRLFVGHFQKGEDIGDLETLVRIAGETGDAESAVRAYLESDQDDGVVRAQIAQIEEMGIGGVPFFIFNRHVAASGAQPVDRLVKAIQESL